MENKIICFECGEKITYEVKETIRKYEGEGYSFELLVKVPFCPECGAPIYDEEFEGEIREKVNEKIREQREIIKRDEILEILKKYNVSQKFLSRLLGWGEITLTRYINGNYTPNHMNSNRLKELNNPYIFQRILDDYLEKNDVIEQKSYEKAQNKVKYELQCLEIKEGKIFKVVNWFLREAEKEAPITHLSLQKLLYFVQCWSIVLLGKDMFKEECQAWIHGAVYPKVYEQFKQFKYMPLPSINENEIFESNELEILNAVKTYYYDVYNARTLENICHKEDPYIEARKDYGEKEKSQIIIQKESMRRYYSKVVLEYDIQLGHMIGIKKYLNNLLDF